jgi:sugar-specific transcriptional regulator TrmB
MSEDESVAHLKTFGLNLYESRAYLALVRGRELTAKGVGQLALIPQSRTYDVLDSLTRKGFALATPDSPRTYLPVVPKKILGTQYLTQKKKIQEVALEAQEEAQAKLDSLNDAYSSLSKNLPATATQEQYASDRVWVLSTRESIESALVELIKESKSTVLRITKPPELGGDEPLDPFYIVGMENRKYLYDALKRKVEMRWLSLAREIPTFMGLEIEVPPERRYIEDEQKISEKFLLVDNNSVLLNLRDPASPRYSSIALSMQSKAVASIFLDHFEKVWREGKPLEDVLPRVEQLVREVVARLKEVGFSRTEVLVYQTLAKRGALNNAILVSELAKKKIQPQDSSAACDRLLRLGLLHRDSTYRLLVVEHPSKVKEAITTGKISLPQSGRITTHQFSSGKNP